MILVNRKTEEIVFEPEIKEWVSHYDTGENKTIIMLGDTVLMTEPGNMSMEMCEEIMSQEFMIFKNECRSSMIINTDELLADVIYMISERLDIAEDTVEEYLTESHMEKVLEKMWDAESDAIDRIVEELEEEGLEESI
jgi:hypothetical protein